MPYDPEVTENGGDILLEPLDTPQRQRAESSYLIDLRRQPRFDIQFPAEAVAEHGESVHVFITNISLSGMRLECSLQVLTALFPGAEPLHEHTPAILQVLFMLPNESGQLASVKVQCRSVYARCDRKNTCQVGMEIMTFEDGKPAYTSYLRQREAAG